MEKKNTYLVIGIIAVFILGLFVFVKMRPADSQPTNPDSGITTTTPTPTVSSAPFDQTMVGEWTWTKTTMSDGAVTTPIKEESFVMTLSPEGNLSSTTDCNSLHGSISLTGQDNGMVVSPLASTMMYCEGSQEATYSAQLQQVNSYKVSGNELWFMLPYDSGTMVFTKN